jgi:hypothetical protein
VEQGTGLLDVFEGHHRKIRNLKIDIVNQSPGKMGSGLPLAQPEQSALLGLHVFDSDDSDPNRLFGLRNQG